MKINEEIDALNTMGLSPIELIVVPKVLGLLFIFPLLIFWGMHLVPLEQCLCLNLCFISGMGIF